MATNRGPKAPAVTGVQRTPRPATIPGIIQTYYHPKFGWVTRGWHGKRRNPPTARELVTREQFAQAAASVKAAPPNESDAARAWTTGSPFTYKDYLTSCRYGRMITADMEDGTQFVSWREANMDVQQLLNSITAMPGAMLFRGPDTWVGLGPGTASQVLTWNATENRPDWITPTGGGGSGGQGVAWPLGYSGTSFSSSSHATKGNVLTATASYTIARLLIGIGASSSGDYVASMATLSAASGTPTITAIIQSPALTLDGSVPQGMYEFVFDAPAAVAAGDTFAVLLTRTDATGTTALRVGTSSTINNLYTLPCVLNSIATADAVSLSVGGTVSVTAGSNAPFAFGLDWKAAA